MAAARIVVALALALAACATAPLPPPRSSAAPQRSDSAASQPAAPGGSGALSRWKERPADGPCRVNLTALARAHLDAFNGLHKCGRVDAEEVLGSSGDQPSRFEQFGEYRVYSFGGSNILVWFLADDIRVIQLLYPKLERPLTGLLGAPDAKAPSRLSADWEQWIYADRGLTAHVKRSSGEVVTLFAYQPTTVAAFLGTDIARVSKSESPLEELK